MRGLLVPLLLLAVLAVGCWWGSDGRWQPRAGPVKLLPQAGQSTPATRYNGPQCLDASQVGAGQPKPYCGALPSLAALNIREASLEQLPVSLDTPWAFEFLPDGDILVT